MEVASIFINRILSDCIKKGASSLHLSVGSLPVFRLDGELESIPGEDILSIDVINGVLNQLLSEEEMSELSVKKELVTVKNIGGDLRFRINAFYQKRLPAISFYYIQNNIKSFEQLNLPEILNNISLFDSGLFVISGNFSSGKTTTCASFIEKINRDEAKYILTIEDPIEYMFVSKKSIINQREVGVDVASLSDGIKYCYNENTDVIYVGDMKKGIISSMPKIIDLASGNSLVVLEVNANSCVNAIEKIINTLASEQSSEAANYGLADVLRGVMTQELVPVRGGGMKPACEILIVNSAVQSLIRENKIFQINSIIQTSREEGMVSMEKAKELLEI